MKLKEWIDFNFIDNKIMNFGDLIIKIFKDKKRIKSDIILETLVNIDVAREIFGDYELLSVGRSLYYHEDGEAYTTLGASLLYKREDNNV